jgi:hypothetical protein
MSFLTPLYILGALAVAAPIVFHLIRRSPRGEVAFSSLMFLSPTPPRLTRRSRLDHVFLLLLRAAALCLLAFAFARPFLRQAAHLDFGEGDRRRIAVVIDTSASMRRGDLWRKAKAVANEAIAGCRPGDQLAVYSFDAVSKPVLGFPESMTLDPVRRPAVAKARLERISPSWAATNLGQALIDTVGAIDDVADASEKAGRMPRRVVLISDLQQGARIDALGEFEWPSDVELELKTVSDNGSNAGLHLVADAPASETDTRRRVRVSNDPTSHREKFELQWLDEKAVGSGKPVSVYVPPGESRVVAVPNPPASARSWSLQLRGDSDGFDNTLFFAAEGKDEATVLYIGKDGVEDPSGLLYYLLRVFDDSPPHRVRVLPHSPAVALSGESDRSLVVLSSETTAENVKWLKRHLQSGGTLLFVLTNTGRSETLAAIADVSPWDIEEATVNRDVMLGEIAFDHPLFASLSGAQFNDFTKIHFWKYRRITPAAISNARILARFENGDVAILEKPLGRGRLVVLASGWNPSDSQLARSSKFVPLMTSLLESRGSRALAATSYQVLERVGLRASEGTANGFVVHKPNGATVNVAPEGNSFSETDQPGVYRVDTPDGAQAFAVNLDPSESKISRLPIETLEQFGCRLVNSTRKAADREHLRQLQNAELEGRQKIWRGLILAAIAVLIVETWLAGRMSRPRAAREEGLSP